MNHATLTSPIFPLPVFLLAGGITRLRIFEPRYLKMVKIANQGKDGVLEIDVKCKALLDIQSIEKK